MKKLVAMLLAGAMVFSMAACGSSDDNKRDEEKDKYVPRKGRRR